LRVALPHAPTTLDPQRAFTPADRALARQLYEPLLRFGPEPEPEPAAALGAVPNEDATEWTFALRPDLRWADGTPLRAEDYVRGWLRVLSRDVPDDLFALFRPIRAAGVYRFDFVDAEAVGLSAPDPSTLVVQTESSAAHFRHVAALWLGAPARPSASANASANEAPSATRVGNGPYVLDSWVVDQHLSLLPNAHYWAGAPPAALTFLMGPQAVEDALTDLSSATKDAAAVLADIVPVPDHLAGTVLGDPRLRGLLVRQPRPATLWLSCNVTRAPLDNALVRKALAYAIDRDAYVAEILGGAGRPAYSLLPAGVPGHDPAAGATYHLRPDAARELVAAAGVDEDQWESLAVTIPATDAGRQSAGFLRDQLERHLGVRLGIVELDRYSYVRALERKHYDLAFAGWEGPYPDPEGWFWLVFGAGKAENRTGWESRALDDLWRRADELPDPRRRLDLYAAAQQVLLDEMPVVFLAQPHRLAAVHPRVQGLTPSVMDEFPGVASFAHVQLRPERANA
ncbi:MAG: peptide ABC transporter substrate-binding protein, partial [Chloroflexota bacterium]